MNNWSNMKKVICGVSALLAMLATLLGFTWAMDDHWTPREIHELFASSVYNQFQELNKRNEIRDAQRDVQYWLKMEMFWRVEVSKDPNNAYKCQQLDNAVRQRAEAEKRQRKLQGK